MAKELSPMMKHYKSLKEQYCDCIILYRLGDFYEMFFEDAVEASSILELTLTGRDCGLTERAPMCGVPHHAVDNYIVRLVSAGKKVAICEQLSIPGEQPGMVKRDVVRVITAGTLTEDGMLNQNESNYLASVYRKNDDFSIAWLDISTGEFKAKDFYESDAESMEDFLLSLLPSEIIAPREVCDTAREFVSIKAGRLVKFTNFYDYSFDFDNAASAIRKQFDIFSLEAIGLQDKPLVVSAAGGLIEYILNTQKRTLGHINRIQYQTDSDTMQLDYNTKRNLELTETQSFGKRNGSLIWVIDKTKTSMGARYLKNWVKHPLQNKDEIEKRQTAVAELVKNAPMRALLGESLSRVKDIERMVSKIAYFSIVPIDMVSLRDSLIQIPDIKKTLGKAVSPILADFCEQLEDFRVITERIAAAIPIEKTPVNLKDGGYIRSGYNAELDSLRAICKSSTQMLTEYEERQKEITGVSALKVRSNRIFGYYIEIPNNKAPAHLPFDYVRKQTVATGERYTSDELQRLETEILGASDKALQLESDLLHELRSFLTAFINRLQKTAYLLAYIDCLYSLSEVAVKNGYVRPKFIEKNEIRITDGRHPVVEELLKRNQFVSNDTVLAKDSTTLILTGPNMAGKSTYIKQVALIVLLAHIGSFVPAGKAELGIVDRIFTRVGASDNLGLGQSTFMVEMLEAANILNNATDKSLLILDEIGRGTSTLDGLSIAWAIVEHIVLKIKAKTLFATHYHELSELEQILDEVKNYRILVQETEKGITFLYKIARGGANRSFGIEVAAIAGVNKEVIKRAKDIMETLAESHALSGDLKLKLSKAPTDTAVVGNQMSLFQEDVRFTEIKHILQELNINKCTPIESLTILSDLKKILEKKV